ncbi:MAG: type II toxin-antitoxin system VapB family antitoxin [Chloroflexi bacterium]|nr:type II toxin-antitoxin system VapB family antitoxin [Chloroflexota bacterium]
MRRTVVIDDKLLEEARKEFGTKGIRETIETAMKEAIRKRKLERVRRSLGTWDLGLTAEELEKMREDGEDE